MRRIPSTAIGVLTALAGGTMAAYLANLAIVWLHISSFGGKSGFFFVTVVVAALLAGFTIGAIGARTAKTLVQAIGRPFGTLLVISAVFLGILRLVGDIPPTIGGDELNVLVELRYPATQEIKTADYPFDNRITLATVGRNGREQKRQLSGLLMLDKVRTEGNMRIVQAEAFLNSQTSERRMRLYIADKERAKFTLPLPANPTPEDEHWTEWANASNGFSYRVRVQRLQKLEEQEEE
jgi:hypothetical protein